MTNRSKKVLIVMAVIAISCSTLFAASLDDLYSEFSSSIESGNIDAAIENYNSLIDEYSSNRPIALSEYAISKEQSNALLTLIVDQSDEDALEDALWLYSVSPSYRPRLSLDYSKSSDNFSYSYFSTVSVKPGADVTLPDQNSIGANSYYLGKLLGWGVTKDEVTYVPGETIKMPITDQSLYAIWTSAVTFNDEKSGLNVSTEGVNEGDEIEIPALTAPEDKSVFVGWYDRSTGELLESDAATYTVKGNGAQFEALYSAFDISNLRSVTYTTLPRNTQVTVMCNVKNTGNVDMKNVEVKITSGDDSLKVLNDTLCFRRLPVGATGSVATRVVYTGTGSSKSLPITVSITDVRGNTWENTFTLNTK